MARPDGEPVGDTQAVPGSLFELPEALPSSAEIAPFQAASQPHQGPVGTGDAAADSLSAAFGAAPDFGGSHQPIQTPTRVPGAGSSQQPTPQQLAAFIHSCATGAEGAVEAALTGPLAPFLPAILLHEMPLFAVSSPRGDCVDVASPHGNAEPGASLLCIGTALHAAAASGHAGVVGALLEAGAMPLAGTSLRDTEGKVGTATPLHLAAAARCVGAANVTWALLEAGAAQGMWLRDGTGRSALATATSAATTVDVDAPEELQDEALEVLAALAAAATGAQPGWLGSPSAGLRAILRGCCEDGVPERLLPLSLLLAAQGGDGALLVPPRSAQFACPPLPFRQSPQHAVMVLAWMLLWAYRERRTVWIAGALGVPVPDVVASGGATWAADTSMALGKGGPDAQARVAAEGRMRNSHVSSTHMRSWQLVRVELWTGPKAALCREGAPATPPGAPWWASAHASLLRVLEAAGEHAQLALPAVTLALARLPGAAADVPALRRPAWDSAVQDAAWALRRTVALSRRRLRRARDVRQRPGGDQA